MQMSKFCGVISKRLNSEELSPLCYDHLETLTDWLHGESDSLEEDFQTKAAFVLEQQQHLLRNEHNFSQLVNVHETMRTLQEQMRATEQHIEVNDANIKMLDANIAALEDYTSRPTVPSRQSCGICAAQHGHQHQQAAWGEQGRLLQMLQNTDQAMQQINAMVDEIDDHMPYVERIHRPYHAISGILDCHVRTLQQTEHNLDCLMDKLNAVNLSFQQALALRQQRSASAPPACSNAIGDGDSNQNMPVNYF